jgi:DNA-binding NtrC family response regulator
MPDARNDRDLGIGNAFIAMNLIGRSPCFREAIEKIRTISEFDVGVYIIGETGTGKELAARAIHYLGARRDHPFIPLSCGGMTDELLLNELFGHAKGAYTGAHAAHPGLIQLSQHGTLFLDEIDSLSPKAQITLLRFLQEKEYKAIGSADVKKVDTRIICAGNRDLEQCVAEGSFRRDLFYRLDILRVELPPLRLRTGDVPLLAQHFINKYTRQFNIGETRLDDGLIQKLTAHTWPGNVRELENAMLKLCILSELPGLADASESPHRSGRPSHPDPIADMDTGEGFKQAKIKAINRFEKQYLQNLLTKTRGNISQASRIAKKERRTFTRLVEKHGLRRIDFLPFNPRTDG